MEYKYEGHSFKSGIYKIINKLNGRIYVGSAKRFIERWQSHTSSLRNQKHQNKFLQADFNKCGEEAFVFEVLEVTEGKSKEERLLIEEGYIKQHYDSGDMCYNLCDRAISRDGCKDKDPEKTRLKRSESSKKMWQNEEYRQKQVEVQRVRMIEQWQNEELREKTLQGIREASKRPEVIENRSKAQRGKKIPESQKQFLRETVGPVTKERWKSPEYKEMVRARMLERWRNDPELRKRQSENIKKSSVSAKTYVLRNPAGEVVTIVNLDEFCANYPTKLTSHCLSKLYRGKLDKYKGWTRVE